MAPPGREPELSVVFPTYGRPARALALLERLAGQTLASERFEVIAVDDGSDPPLELPAAWPFAFTFLRQANAGPGAARNRALEHARAELCLILNDDAVPAPDLLEGHLAAHRARAGEKLCVLGTFHFDASSRQSAFVELLDRTDLLFDFSSLRPGELHGWTCFWTCNISLPTSALRHVGGFDAERFRDIVEDVELGYRLEQQGYRILFDPALVAEHAHRWGIQAYFERGVRLGRNLVAMWRKHGDATALRLARGTPVGEPFLRQLQATYEAYHEQRDKAEALLEKLERDHAEHPGRALAPQSVQALAALVARVSSVPLARGMIEGLTGVDPEPVMRSGAAPGALTSVIVVAHDDLPSTQRCIESLRRHAEPGFATEILAVDNGSRDGTREWLAAQADVRLLANAENLGAPRARNQALEFVQGEWVVFLDNDVVLTPGWLARLRFHAEVDPACACVGPRTDRAAHGQALAFDGGDDLAALDAFAVARARSERRRFRHALLLSSFCLLVSRRVLDEIGGFDERFTPWGFEDDDFTLRAALTGRHNRIAEDVFVRHAPYGGPKLARHSELLEENWRRFAAKWGLAPGTPRGDYRALEGLLGARHDADTLYLPLRGEEACATS